MNIIQNLPIHLVREILEEMNFIFDDGLSVNDFTDIGLEKMIQKYKINLNFEYEFKNTVDNPNVAMFKKAIKNCGNLDYVIVNQSHHNNSINIIMDYIKSSRKLNAIKKIKETFGLGLKESKEIADELKKLI